MSRVAKLGIVAGVLLVVAIVVHWALDYSLGDVLHGYEPEFMWKDVFDPELARVAELPDAMGPEDAPVELTVFAAGPIGCPQPLMDLIDNAYEQYPGVLHIVYKDMRDKEIHKLAEEHKIGCFMGVLVNGKNKFTIPGRESKYGEVVMFDGPPSPTPPEGQELVPMHGSPGYTAEDFEAAIEQELVAAGLDPDHLPEPEPAEEAEQTTEQQAGPAPSGSEEGTPEQGATN